MNAQTNSEKNRSQQEVGLDVVGRLRKLPTEDWRSHRWHQVWGIVWEGQSLVEETNLW